MNTHKQLLGMVRRGKFYILAPEDLQTGPIGLTGIRKTEARSPESAEIDLSNYENRVILVNGEIESDWLYAADVAEEAGPVLSNFLEIYFSQEEREKKLCVLVIGHHPDKPGGVNLKSNISEFEFNKDLAPRIEKKVQTVRVQKLFYQSYETLPQDINFLNPDFVISLHCNYYDSVVSGTEVLYCYDDLKGKEIAGILLQHLVQHLGLRNRGLVPRREGELGYHVLCNTNAPSVIAEPFFISNDQDLARAQEDLEGLVQAYADAIDKIAEMIN